MGLEISAVTVKNNKVIRLGETIRNFYGLHEYFEKTLGLTETDDCFYLSRDMIDRLYVDASNLNIPEIDEFNYEDKCSKVKQICEEALPLMNIADDLVEFWFSK